MSSNLSDIIILIEMFNTKLSGAPIPADQKIHSPGIASDLSYDL